MCVVAKGNSFPIVLSVVFKVSWFNNYFIKRTHKKQS